MSLQMMKRSMSRMLKQSIIDLCRNSMGAEGYVEIDGIVCITIGEDETEEIVVKVHEIIGDDEESDHFSIPHNLPPTSRLSPRIIQSPLGRPRMPNAGTSMSNNKPGFLPVSSKGHASGHHGPLYTQAGSLKSSTVGTGQDAYRRQALTPNRNQQDLKKQQQQSQQVKTHDGAVIKIEIDSDDESSTETTPPGKKGDVPRTCSICDQNLSSVRVLKQHVKEVHDAVVCETCWQPFATQADLNKHMKTHEKNQGQQRPVASPRNDGKSDKKDSGERFKCGVCGNTSDVRQTMVDHLRSGHEFQGCYTCMLCREYFPNKPTFTIHRKLSHPTAKDVECQNCGVGLLQKEFENHKKECGREEKQQQSGKRRATESAGNPAPKQPRNETHGQGSRNSNSNLPGDKKFECPICCQYLNSFQNYERHMSSVHSRLLCSICATTLKNNRAAQKHMKRHTDAMPFKCDKCGLGSQSHLEVRRHMVVAHDHHPAYFTCPQCNVFHESRIDFAAHMKETHKVEYIDEDELENYVVFDDEDDYNEDEEDEEDYDEEEAYNQNSGQFNAGQGQAYHDEEQGAYDDEMDEDGEYEGMEDHHQLVTCHICELNVPTLVHLKEHISTVHHAVVCEICWRPFLTQAELDMHMKTHSKEGSASGTKDTGSKTQTSKQVTSVSNSASTTTNTGNKNTGGNSSQSTKPATAFKCGVCGSASEGRNAMVEHLKAAHEYLGCFTCLLCGEFFPNKPTFTIHRRLSHNTANDFDCPSCGVGLYEHEVSHHTKECQSTGVDIKDTEWDTKKDIKQEKKDD